jgi:hypothetical protein
MRTTLCVTLSALMLMSGAAGGLDAQQVVIEGTRDTRAVRVLERILADGDFLLVTRDTTFEADFVTERPMVIWDADVALAGVIDAPVAVIRATLAIRPGSRVAGPIASLEGVVLRSGLADVGRVDELPADRWVRARLEEEVLYVRISGPPPVPAVGLAGFAGFRRIAYDRVDGMSVSWGPEWRLTRREFGPRAEGWITLRSARSAVGGGGVLWIPLGDAVELVVRGERATRSTEDWIRSEAVNSIEALLAGRDVRDHHESDRVAIRVARRPAPAGRAPALEVLPFVELSGSRDRALPATRPWALTDRDALARPNLAVDEDEIRAVEAGISLSWLGRRSRAAGRLSAEHGRVREANTRFNRWHFGGRWEMDALWDHRLDVDAQAFGSFGDDPPPLQRWSFVGGAGTLPTFPVAAFRGDHLVHLRTRYAIPLPFDLPLAGTPSLEALHATGTAWTDAVEMPAWEQNLGLGVAVSVVRLRAWVDPAESRPRPTWLVEAAIR